MSIKTADITTAKAACDVSDLWDELQYILDPHARQGMEKILAKLMEVNKAVLTLLGTAETVASDQTAGATGSVLAGASSQALTVKNGLIVTIG
jgi:hypothetical protein